MTIICQTSKVDECKCTLQMHAANANANANAIANANARKNTLQMMTRMSKRSKNIDRMIKIMNEDSNTAKFTFFYGSIHV